MGPDSVREEEEERKKKEEKEKNEGDGIATAATAKEKRAKRTPTSDDDDDDDNMAAGEEGEEDATLLTNMERGGLDDEGDGCHDDGGFRLHDINLEVKRGELVAVIGRVGSGKTSLLNSMLGEMKRAAGQLHRNASAVSYVSQRSVPHTCSRPSSTFLELED